MLTLGGGCVVQLWNKHQKAKVTLLRIFKDLLQEVQARWVAAQMQSPGQSSGQSKHSLPHARTHHRHHYTLSLPPEARSSADALHVEAAKFLPLVDSPDLNRTQ